MNAIYAAYLTGATGNSFALLVFNNGVLCGADAGNALYDGEYDVRDNCVTGKVVINFPSQASVITGVVAGPKPMSLELPLSLQLPLEQVPFHTIESALGRINARFEKLRDIDV
ncbi:hypothetical protein [Maricaulis sp.]|uniref:hypothetical protein n=1 Tax=Maricaulis sp. TaxID=1486257 RepID=UPI003A946763